MALEALDGSDGARAPQGGSKVQSSWSSRRHLHNVRHFNATQLIVAGVDARTVAGRLGHADPRVTFRVHSHALEERDRGGIMGGNALVRRWELWRTNLIKRTPGRKQHRQSWDVMSVLFRRRKREVSQR